MRPPVRTASSVYSMEHSFTHALDPMLPSDADRDLARHNPRPIWRIVLVSLQADGTMQRSHHSTHFDEPRCDAVMDTIALTVAAESEQTSRRAYVQALGVVDDIQFSADNGWEGGVIGAIISDFPVLRALVLRALQEGGMARGLDDHGEETTVWIGYRADGRCVKGITYGRELLDALLESRFRWLRYGQPVPDQDVPDDLDVRELFVRRLGDAWEYTGITEDGYEPIFPAEAVRP